MSEQVSQQNSSETEYKEVMLGPRSVRIPISWEVKKFSSPDITEKIKAGGTPKATNEDFYGGKIKYVKIEDITAAEKFIKNTKNHLTQEGLESSSTWLVPEGSLLLSMYGSYGKVVITGDEVATNQAILGIIPSDSVDLDYLYYAASRLKPYFESVVLETTQANLNKGIVENTPLLFPPRPEQHRIAEVISTVDEKIQKTNEIIEETTALKRGLMQDLLVQGIGHDEYEERYLGPRKLKIPSEWEKARLDDVSEIITRGKQPTYVEEGGVPVLNQSCIYWDGFHPEELKRLDKEVADSWKDKYWVKEGDVLINSTGKGTLGRALEWTKGSNTHTLDSHITRVHPDKSILDPTYFRFYLESNHGQKMLYAFCVAGSTGQIELSKTDLQTMPILLPPLEEQKCISEAFHRVNRKLQDEQSTKEELQDLKQGLMQDLLTGKVRVNSHN